ncbi:MAG: DUF7687 domain-containing protein [Elstera sp.]|jgi:hypothetical protein
MQANPNFSGQPAKFWALVRTLSEEIGYTVRRKKNEPAGAGRIKSHTLGEMANALRSLHLDPLLVEDGDGNATPLGQLLIDYFEYRAKTIEVDVQRYLMNKDEAKSIFEKTYRKLKPKCPIPMNKQKGEKREPAYLTALVNMIVESKIGKLHCDFDPRQLTTFTKNGEPLQTLARRVDGAFPSPVNPIAVWEVKEYYFTTTFGSRVADGVYETLLDGLELRQLKESHDVSVEHLLFVDSHYTWWECGKSYLCRMVDMINMGLVTEVIFGKEVLERLPMIAERWASRFR